MYITDKDHQEMEHEPMRTESTGDITAAQPIGGYDEEISANSQRQQAYINNNPHTEQENTNFLPNFWYQYATALNYPVLNPVLTALWSNMGNGTSGPGGGPSNVNLTIGGNTYDLAQVNMLLLRLRDDLAHKEV